MTLAVARDQGAFGLPAAARGADERSAEPAAEGAARDPDAAPVASFGPVPVPSAVPGGESAARGPDEEGRFSPADVGGATGPDARRPRPTAGGGRRRPGARGDHAAALDDAWFAAAMARLGPFERAPLLAVGVSGGADSAALVLLADRWARARGGAVRAFIVDHGLRPGSAKEAGRVRVRLRRRGIAAEVLSAWPATGPALPPRSRIQERCRERRLELLVEAAVATGALHLLLAHHADDQAETLAMRAERGDPGDGAAGIAAIRELPALRLLRPLLGASRAALEATCRALRWAPVEDPSNRDPRFERVRVRVRLRRAGQEASGNKAVATAVAVTDATAAAARTRATAERALAAWLAAHASVDPWGWVALDRGAWQAADPLLRRRILRAALGCVTGRVHPPRGRSLERTAAALATPGRVTRTLGGCLLVARRDVIGIGREPRAVAPGDWPGRFDGRFRVPSDVTRPVALGIEGRRGLPPALGEALRRRGVPDYVIETVPAQPGATGGPPARPVEAVLDPARPLAPAPFPVIALA